MRRAILVLLFLIPVMAWAQPVSLLHKSYAEKYNWCDSLYRIRGSFVKEPLHATFDNIRKWALEKDDHELADLAEFTWLRVVLVYDDYPMPDVEKRLLELKSDAIARKLKYLEANTLHTLGFYYWNNLKKHYLAFECYITAYKLLSGFTREEFPYKREYIYTLGTAYYVYDDYENAKTYLLEALAIKSNRPGEFDLALLNNLGLCYRKLLLYDSSYYYFNLIYRSDTGEMKSIAGGNIGINYYLQKRYDEAIPLLLQDIESSFTKNINIRNAANSMYVLASIYVEQHDADKAERLMQRALTACRPKHFWPDYPLQEKIFTLLHRIYTIKGNDRLANLYADSALTAKDSVQALYNSLNLAKAQEKTEFIQHKLEKEQLVSQKKIQALIRNSLIVLIFLVMIISILFINRQRLKQNRLVAEKKNAEAELNAASRQLESFRQAAQEKNNLIEQFSNEIERMKQGEQDKADNQVISQLEQSIILTDQQWEDFKIAFEKVHKGFFAGLKKKIPDLTQSEIRFLALTKLKLTSKEMASMLGVSTNTIRTYRHRLRKKFDLDKDEMVDDLVDDL